MTKNLAAIVLLILTLGLGVYSYVATNQITKRAESVGGSTDPEKVNTPADRASHPERPDPGKKSN